MTQKANVASTRYLGALDILSMPPATTTSFLHTLNPLKLSPKNCKIILIFSLVICWKFNFWREYYGCLFNCEHPNWTPLWRWDWLHTVLNFLLWERGIGTRLHDRAAPANSQREMGWNVEASKVHLPSLWIAVPPKERRQYWYAMETGKAQASQGQPWCT